MQYRLGKTGLATPPFEGAALPVVGGHIWRVFPQNVALDAGQKDGRRPPTVSSPTRRLFGFLAAVGISVSRPFAGDCGGDSAGEQVGGRRGRAAVLSEVALRFFPPRR